MNKTQDQQDSALLLSFSNAMALVTNNQGLIDVIDGTLKEYFLINGFMLHIPAANGFADNFVLNGQFSVLTTSGTEWQNFAENFKPAEHIIEQLIKNDAPLVLNSEKIAENAPIGQPKIRTAIGLHLKLKERSIGAIWLFYLRDRTFTSNHNRLLKAIGLQIALAVNRKISEEALVNRLVDEKIARQLREIDHFKQQLEEEKLYLQQEVSGGYSFGEIIGSGPEMKHVYEQMSQVAGANSTVLILGETGTGKELIARAIHNTSKRRDKLMVKVNCASIPQNLIESELFGHEKGAFTGAFERRIGKFELANNGTLFLDEIGEMPLDLQVKLLRAIQEREIERIGGKTVIKVNVRIIAATNRDLFREVQEGNFRSDLYYRLNVFPITMPALRNRKEDIPLLTNYFINRFSRNTGKKVERISSNAMKDLMAYDWPGNVRELEHLLERSTLMSKTDVIKEVHLPNTGGKPSQPGSGEIYVKTSLENERDHILFVLEKCNGKIYGRGGAAELLDMHVSTLNSRIKKLGIKKEQVFKFNDQS